MLLKGINVEEVLHGMCRTHLMKRSCRLASAQREVSTFGTEQDNVLLADVLENILLYGLHSNGCRSI